MSRSLTTIKLLKAAGLPTHRRPTTPGEVIEEEFLSPMSLSQTALARAMKIPTQRLNLIIRGKRAVTPDTALRLSQCLGASIQFWLNLQHAVDLWDAISTQRVEAIAKLPRLRSQNSPAATI